MKRTLERELKVSEFAESEANEISHEGKIVLGMLDFTSVQCKLCCW